MAQQNVSKIGVATATIIGMNAMIGAGIFAAPTAIGMYVGPAGIVAYMFVIIAVWFMAQSLARVAARFPEEGSFYAYTKQWGGHWLGAFAGVCYIVGLMIAMGLLAHTAGDYLVPIFPAYGAHTLGLAALGILVLLNMFGVVLSELGQQILIITTTFPLILTTIMCFSKASIAYLTPFAPHGLHNIFSATRAVIFGFFGFECASSLFAIVKDPQKNVPRALNYSIMIVGVIYLLFVASIILSTPLELFQPGILLTDVLRTIFPNQTWILWTIHLSILSAIVGTIHSMVWSSSALLVSLFRQIGNCSLSQPLSVLLVGASILSSFIFLKNIDLFFSLTALFILIAYTLSMIGLLWIPDEWKSGKNFITIGGLIMAAIMIYFAVEGLILYS